MSRYNIGDKVLIEAKISDVDFEDGSYLYRVTFSSEESIWINEIDLFERNKTYEDGQNDAWELAGKLNELRSPDETAKLFKIFNVLRFSQIFETYSYQEAVAKIEAYEAANSLQRDDVVELPNKSLGVVTYADRQLDKYTVVDSWGRGTNGYSAKQLRKTGRTLNISHLLDKIKED